MNSGGWQREGRSRGSLTAPVTALVATTVQGDPAGPTDDPAAAVVPTHNRPDRIFDCAIQEGSTEGRTLDAAAIAVTDSERIP